MFANVLQVYYKLLQVIHNEKLYHFFIAVQHERGPRNSTLRRQMALYFKEPEIMNSMVASAPTALDLVLPKAPSEPRVSMPRPSPHPSLPHPVYCNALTVSKVRLHLIYINI